MDGQAIVTISAVVVTLTQLIKFAGLPDKRGPLVVLGLSALGVVFWGYAEGTYERAKAFEYFAGWISVATSAAGVFGFIRSGPAAVVATKAPPAGAGAEPVKKDVL